MTEVYSIFHLFKFTEKDFVNKVGKMYKNNSILAHADSESEIKYNKNFHENCGGVTI